MINKPEFIDNMVQKICTCLPDGIKSLKADTEENLRSVIQAGFERMHLVTKTEFDVQKKILQRTQEEMQALEEQVKQLQASIDGSKQSEA